MANEPTRYGKKREYLISILAVLLVAGISYMAQDLLGYRVAALLLLVTVSLLAMLFDILPVLLASILSALCWDYFFIPPRYTITVGSGEDLLLLLMYFVIALINAALTYQIRKRERMLQRKEEKEKAIKLYNTLLNSLSHELRTPISAIITASDTLKEGMDDMDSSNEVQLVDGISVSAIRLQHQVENLLNMSRIDSGVLQPKPDWCDVKELIYQVIGKCAHGDARKNIVVHISEELPLFKIDYGLTSQVLENLLNNALSHTASGTEIRIEANISEEIEGSIEVNDGSIALHRDKKTNYLVLKVADNGKGFPEDEMPYVFDKFYRLKNTKPGGTGLGLSIVKGFVEAQKGEVRLSNLPEGGALFTIYLPAEVSYINALKNE
ncbi:MAG: ATP-binding protein [Chitinophagales bacterium]